MTEIKLKVIRNGNTFTNKLKNTKTEVLDIEINGKRLERGFTFKPFVQMTGITFNKNEVKYITLKEVC